MRDRHRLLQLPAQAVRPLAKRWRGLTLLAVGGAVAVSLLSGPYARHVEARSHVADVAAALAELEAANADLEQRVAQLHDSRFVEVEARRHLGLVYPEEQPYLLHAPQGPPDPPLRGRPPQVDRFDLGLR